MSLLPKCREVTRLVLQGEDRPLRVGERLRVRLHITMCDACTRFRQQVGFMRSALGQWRRYGGDEDGGPD
ncbi:MAG: zf-HC2 domain-containing protein [Burkholderiales bacterium]